MSHAPHDMSIVCNGVENSTRKEPTMKTFLQTRATFLETLAQLKRLAGAEHVIQALRVVKEGKQYATDPRPHPCPRDLCMCLWLHDVS
jgi:hypothetical protein